MAQPPLTRAEVERAANREGVQHPVISVLEYHSPRLSELSEPYRRIADTQEAQRYSDGNLGFLADAIEEAGDFSLNPLDLVAIWSKAMDLPLGGYFRYDLAGMISAAYGIRGIQTSGWDGFPRYFSERGRLPKSVAKDRSGLLYVHERLETIGNNLMSSIFIFPVEEENPQ